MVNNYSNKLDNGFTIEQILSMDFGSIDDFEGSYTDKICQYAVRACKLIRDYKG